MFGLRIASSQEAKWFYTLRTTRGHQFWEFLTNSVRYGFHLTYFTSCLSVLLMIELIKALNDRLIGSKTWNRNVKIVGAFLDNP